MQAGAVAVGPAAGSVLGVLANVGWLSEQSAEFQTWAARAGGWRIYEPRQTIYDVGEEPDGLYGLGEGAFEMTFPLIADEPVVIYRAEVGCWFGDAAVLPESRRLVSITAVSRCKIFRIPAVAMRELVRRTPEHWRAFHDLSHVNFMKILTVLAETMALSPKARVARTLIRLAGAEGRAQVTQIELAQLIGMTRSTMQRSIAELTEAGAIETGYGTLIVRDAAALDRASHDR